MTGLTFIVFFIALKLQKYTTTGRFASVDDDTAIGARGAHQTHVTAIYNWCLYGALGIILAEAHAIIYVGAARPGAGFRDAAARVAWFACDVPLARRLLRFGRARRRSRAARRSARCSRSASC